MPSPTPPGAWAELRLLWASRSLLWAFVHQELQMRYLGSSVGLYWTLIHPLLQLITYTFVFHTLIGVKFHPQGSTLHYVLFLFGGMVTWNAFQEGLTRATSSLSEHGHLLRKMNFPSIVLPAKAVVGTTLNHSIGLGILMLAALFLGDGLSPHILLVPVFIFIQAAFTLGLGMLTATLQLYYRDMGHWVQSALFAGLFLTPVFYPASAWPRPFLLLLYLNPMAQLVGIFQGLILNQHFPVFNQLLFPTVVAGLVLVVGSSVFAHNRRHFADLV
ncbi:MAG TPA: ABC transporter permease [Myxococcota bacterium]|nr:ABC transporter permease [Myxococcota bacterium]